MIPYRSEQEIIQNLKDAGCDEATILAFMDDFKHRKQSKGYKMLQQHRYNLLADLHTNQKRIDCLDYLLFVLRKQDEQ